VSAATIERELAEYLALSDYEVRFRPAMSYSWFYVYVFYRGKTVTFKSCCRSYPRAARWARRQIRRHEKAMRDLGPLVRP
jgi:hypothetical protein